MLLISFSGFIFADQCDSYIKKKNYEKSFVVCKEQAEQGVAKSQFDLAAMYSLGNGIGVDYKPAFYRYQKVATEVKWHLQETNQDQLEAINKLALLYYHGTGG